MKNDLNQEILRQPVNLAESVYYQIRRKILSGKYTPGEAVTEGEVAKELGVSRTPVREAFKQLESEGLLELRPNRGALVVGIGRSDIEDIYEIRSLLEGRAAERAATKADEASMEQLSEIVDLTEFYIERGDYDRVTAMDDRFHRTIYELTGSRMLQKILKELHAYAENIRERSIREPGRAEQMLKEHRAILEAMKRKDPENAGSLMIEHVRASAANMEKNHLMEN
ncbi:MAG: GntR family transcriptional regulator [Firmicutes bacterium]|nr:GntR family transcriptional regulator [Bacillota bacterium]